MNTNSKHYEDLNIQPWEIMERNFTTEEFIAYLKGNIIKYTLRDKGQALTDAQKIKHYAEKLIEVLETQENDKDNWDIVTGELLEPVYTPKAEPKEPEVKHKFKVGDRVRVVMHNETGTIIRTPVEGLGETDTYYYIVELDKEYDGWKASKERHLVESDNAWYADDKELELLKEEPKKTLKSNQWYDAKDFTVGELKELLPLGTRVIITREQDNDREVDLENEEEVGGVEVTNITKRIITQDTRIATDYDCWYRRYFKIVEE